VSQTFPGSGTRRGECDRGGTETWRSGEREPARWGYYSFGRKFSLGSADSYFLDGGAKQGTRTPKGGSVKSMWWMQKKSTHPPRRGRKATKRKGGDMCGDQLGNTARGCGNLGTGKQGWVIGKGGGGVGGAVNWGAWEGGASACSGSYFKAIAAGRTRARSASPMKSTLQLGASNCQRGGNADAKERRAIKKTKRGGEASCRRHRRIARVRGQPHALVTGFLSHQRVQGRSRGR